MLSQLNRVSPLLVLLATSVGLLASVQSLHALETFASRAPVLLNIEYWPATHTREEVAGSRVDVSADEHQESANWSPAPVRMSTTPESADEVEIAASPPQRMIHRRVSPRSPDDAVPSA